MGKRIFLILVVGALALVSAPRIGAQPTLDKELFVYNWDDYMDETLIDEYEQQYGVKITFDNYATNEELFAKIQAGANYDVIFPSDYMVARLIALGLIAKIDRANVPNWANLDPANLDAWYDPQSEYCLPWMWGTTGIAYHTSLERVPDSWAAFFDSEQAQWYAEHGGINLLDDQRELIGAALKYLGYSLNETDPEKLAQARDTIIAILPTVRYINSADYQDTLLPTKEVLISHSWGGSTAKVALQTATAENPLGEWRQVMPKEGGVRFQDSACIPANSTRKATAEHFINFLMDAKNAARSSNVTGFTTANKAAREFIKPELLTFLPPDDVLDKLEFIKPLDEEALKLWDQIWTEIRASQ